MQNSPTSPASVETEETSQKLEELIRYLRKLLLRKALSDPSWPSGRVTSKVTFFCSPDETHSAADNCQNTRAFFDMNVEEVYVRISRSHFVPGLRRIHVSLFRQAGQELLQGQCTNTLCNSSWPGCLYMCVCVCVKISHFVTITILRSQPVLFYVVDVFHVPLE
jgi:hypothetical protein